jgi:glycosyltransferase involved in cell wall biosynthesis
VLYGDKIEMGDFTEEYIEAYKQALIHRLKNPPTEKERQEMMRVAREKFDWAKTAQQWNKEMQ